MRSLILFLAFLIPWLLVGGLVYAAFYAATVYRDKDLTAACALGAGMIALWIGIPFTLMVMAALDPKNDKDKK
jgi:hypothetical protein